jgi:hypothetical protein
MVEGSINPDGVRYVSRAQITDLYMPSKRPMYPIHSDTITSTASSLAARDKALTSNARREGAAEQDGRKGVGRVEFGLPRAGMDGMGGTGYRFRLQCLHPPSRLESRSPRHPSRWLSPTAR